MIFITFSWIFLEETNLVYFFFKDEFVHIFGLEIFCRWKKRKGWLESAPKVWISSIFILSKSWISKHLKGFYHVLNWLEGSNWSLEKVDGKTNLLFQAFSRFFQKNERDCEPFRVNWNENSNDDINLKPLKNFKSLYNKILRFQITNDDFHL